jgi:hypothetical protein
MRCSALLAAAAAVQKHPARARAAAAAVWTWPAVLAVLHSLDGAVSRRREKIGLGVNRWGASGKRRLSSPRLGHAIKAQRLSGYFNTRVALL